MKIPFMPFEIKRFKETKVKVNEELGETGTQIYGGLISGEDHVPELTGSSALDIYEKMRKSDGVIGASLLACELPIRAAKFYVEPASNDKQDIDIAEFIEYNLLKGMTITWDDFLRQALLELPFGFSVFEKVFIPMQYQGKTLIGWKKFAPRLPLTIYKWETEDGGDGITQMLPDGRRVSIPIEKLLIFTNRKEGDNWLGTSILRTSYRSWYIKQNLEKINAIAIERQGIGIPVANLPQNATKTDEERAEKILSNLRSNQKAHLLIPFGWQIGLLDMKGTSVIDPTPTINRLNREIFYSVLAQFLDLGSQPNGSRALSTDQSTIFHNNLQAYARQICDVINNYAIKQLVDMNWDVKDYPTLKYTRIGKVDLTEITSAIQRLAMSGALTPDKGLEDYMRDAMNLPEREEEVPEEPKPKEEKTANEKKFAEQWMPRRPLTFAEHKIKWLDVHGTFEKSEEELKKQLKEVFDDIKNDLTRQVQRALSNSSPAERRKAISELNVGYASKLRQIIFRGLKNSFEYGKTSASHEMREEVPTTPSEMISILSSKADILVESAINDLLKEAKLTLINKLEGKRFDEVPLSIILAALGKSLNTKIEKLLNGIPSVVVSGGINQGRRVAFNSYQDNIYALQRSELLDEKTCGFCESMDGRVVKKDDPITKEDGFHISCRGLWVEIMKDELEKPEISGIPDGLRSSYKGFDKIE